MLRTPQEVYIIWNILKMWEKSELLGHLWKNVNGYKYWEKNQIISKNNTL